MVDCACFSYFANEGAVYCGSESLLMKDTPWIAHPVFEGVSLKHLITSEETEGTFSYHLVKIEPGKSIGDHMHVDQIETHEVIAGGGICSKEGLEIEYRPGALLFIEGNVSHEVHAHDKGLCFFAKC